MAFETLKKFKFETSSEVNYIRANITSYVLDRLKNIEELVRMIMNIHENTRIYGPLVELNLKTLKKYLFQ